MSRPLTREEKADRIGFIVLTVLSVISIFACVGGWVWFWILYSYYPR